MHSVSWESENFITTVLVLRLCGRLVPEIVMLSPPRRLRPKLGSAPEIVQSTAWAATSAALGIKP